MSKIRDTQDETPTLVSDIVDNAAVFGVTREFAAGALYGKETVTRSEVVALIKAFAGRPVVHEFDDVKAVDFKPLDNTKNGEVGQ